MSIPAGVIRNCSDDCDNPQHALAVTLEQCGDAAPLQVEIANPTPDVEKIFECRDGEKWLIECIYEFDTDGNPTKTILDETNTGEDCKEFELERYEECRNDEIWIVEAQYTEDENGDVVKTIVDETNTGLPCVTPVQHMFCKKWQTLAIGIDNTGTRFNENFVVELTLSDGSTVQFTQTPTAGWSQQIDQWVTELQALFPDCDIAPRCNIDGGCGGFLGPVSDAPLPRMFARYVHISCCPTGVYPVSARVVEGDREGTDLIVDFNTTPIKRGYQCVDCDGNVGPLLNEDGSEVPAADLPACTFDCAEVLPETPATQVEVFLGCDDGTDPVTDVVAYLNTQTNTFQYFTENADGALEPYELVGTFLIGCETAPELNDEIIAVEILCDEFSFIEVEGVRYIRQECGPGTVKWVHESEDIAIIDEQTIVGGWAFVINSGIDPATCSVEAAAVLPGTAPDPTQQLESTDSVRFERIKKKLADGSLTFEDVVDVSSEKGNTLQPYTTTGEVVICGASQEDCDSCQPDVQTDTVCSGVEQTIDGVTIPAGQPIIRKVVTYFTKENCDCVESSQATLYFNFQDPTQQFTETPAFDGVCNSETDTVTRCDRNGNEIQVTTLTVFTDDGGLIVTTYADSNGQPIPDPLLPLSICNPDVEPVKACITTDTGETVYGILHVQYDTAGNPGYDVSTFTANNGMSQTLGNTEFKLNCEETCVDCVVEETEYCYDTSAFTFGCDTSTLTIDNQVVDLCGETSGNGVFITEGDICVTGGIRSENEPTRHPDAANLTGTGYDINAITTDALGIASTPTVIGGASQAGNQTVKALFGADVFGLSGTAPTITLSGDWLVGSGIGVGVYDCASDTILPFAPGETQTPATFDQSGFGVEIFNSPTGVWGGATGSHSWQVDTSSVADLSTLVIYTVVINPTGDELSNLSVNGQLPTAPSCDVTDLETLVEILGQTTGTIWTVNGDTICTKTDQELGALTCGVDSAAPTVTVEEITQKADLTRICKADLDYLIEGLTSAIVGDSTECPCEDETVQACTQLLAFDYDRGLVTPGDTSAYRIFLDGNEEATVVHDYTTTSDGLNVSSYYDPIIAAINAVPGWSISLVTDVLQTDQGKVLWQVDFNGTAPSELRIELADGVGGLGNGDAYIFSVDAAGVLTTSVEDGGNPQPDYETPIFSEC